MSRPIRSERISLMAPPASSSFRRLAQSPENGRPPLREDRRGQNTVVGQLEIGVSTGCCWSSLWDDQTMVACVRVIASASQIF